MKLKLYLLLAALVSPVLAVGPTALTQSVEQPTSGSFSITTVNGSITAFTLTQNYAKNVTTIGGAMIVQVAPVPSSVSIDLVANAAKTVTVNATQYTYAQVQAIVEGVMAQERTTQGGPF